MISFILNAICVLPLLCNGQVQKCLKLLSTSNKETDVQLILLRDSQILPQFYNGSGPCMKLLKAVSFRVGGTCVDLDVSTINVDEVQKCAQKSKDYTHFKKCVWNDKTVSAGGVIVPVTRRKDITSGNGTIACFGEKKCQKDSMMAYAMVQIESRRNNISVPAPPTDAPLPSDPASLSYCVYLKNPSPDGKEVTLGVYRDTRILPQWYTWRGRCREVVHADSFKVNGVCNNFDIHPWDVEARNRCNYLKAQDSVAFKKCFWNSTTVYESGVVSTRNARVGSVLEVELFDEADCDVKIDEGKILVQI